MSSDPPQPVSAPAASPVTTSFTTTSSTTTSVTTMPSRPPVTPEFADYVALRLPALLRLAHALTGNPHDASDLVQDVLERVGTKWDSLRRHGQHPDAYLRRAMINTRISRWRRRRPETLVAQIPDTYRTEHDRLENEPLWQALRDLPVQQRTVIVLRYYEDLSEAEIAAAMGIAPGTVKGYASRAMATLRRRLAEPATGPLGPTGTLDPPDTGRPAEGPA